MNEAIAIERLQRHIKDTEHQFLKRFGEIELRYTMQIYFPNYYTFFARLKRALLRFYRFILGL